MKVLVVLASFMSAAILPACAQTVNITPAMSQAEIQTAINTAVSGGVVSFASGTYNLTSGTESTGWSSLTFPAGIKYTGPKPPNLPAILYSTGDYGVVFFNAATDTGNHGLTITNLTFNGGGIYLGGALTNIHIENNVIENINGPYNDGHTETGIFMDTSATNSDFSYNSFYNFGAGFVNSSDPDDNDDSSNAGIFGYGLSNVTIEHNLFNMVNEGVHIFYDNQNGEGVYIDFNNFYALHRIAIEQQESLAGGVEIAYNSVINPLNGYADTYGLSIAATSQTSTGIKVHNNLANANTQLNSNAPWYGYGIELWGIGTNASYNTIEGYWGNGISFGSSQTGNLTVDYNTLCGPDMSPDQFIDHENTSDPPTGYVNETGNLESANMTCGASGTVLEPGVYAVFDSANYALDGGQYMAYTPLEDSLQEYTQRADDGYQRWFFTLQSAGVFQICNLQDAADGDYFSCLSDQSGTVSFGYAPDNWTVAASGDGFTFQNVRTGKYLQDPSTENGIITTSSTPSV